MHSHALTIGIMALAVAVSGEAKAQDIANGEDVFKRCRACHQVGEAAKNGQGPHLNGLLGRKAGGVDGFNFSDANKNSGLIWDEKNFATYIKDPKAAMPGNRMAFIGLKDEADVADLTAFLKQFDAAGKKK